MYKNVTLKIEIIYIYKRLKYINFNFILYFYKHIIISYIIFDDQYYARVIFDTFLNSVCYFSIFIIFFIQ